ncbi:MAG: diaminopimelate epimerase [Jatrophihabitans sp.]
MSELTVWKGHGTENDFVVLPDLDSALDLTTDQVRHLCDRRAGIGADGVLRVVRSQTVPDWADPDTEFAMDFRNADGTTGEMCGNGVRVFARYLQEAGLWSGGPVRIATRGGTRAVTAGADGRFTVDMGEPEVEQRTVQVRTGHFAGAGTPVAMPNPHVVVVLDADRLAALDLCTAPEVTPELPHGQNVEFAVSLGGRHARMRVHERGVGETRSCGTGICSVVAVLAGADHTGEWQVDVPGGSCSVTWTAGGALLLAGPAVLVGRVELSPDWLDR